MALAIASCYQEIGLGPRPSPMSDTARSNASGAQHLTGNHARHRHGQDKRGEHTRKELTALALGALGVVYGDIGTSPLYAMRECLNATGEHAVRGSNAANVFGVVSLNRVMELGLQIEL
jgi:KUP system potassium uptake protein